MSDEPKQKNDVQGPASAGQQAAAEAGDVAAKLTECEKQRDEYLNGWKRAQADFANYKKEDQKRFDDAAAYVQMGVIKEVLPALDSFGFALGTVDKDSAAYKGMILIQNQLLEGLKRRGVEKIPVSRGDMFNPAMHEAMMEVDMSPEEKEMSGKIVEELVAGYTMQGRTLRAAKVKLAK